jgi:hypothetical protein
VGFASHQPILHSGSFRNPAITRQEDDVLAQNFKTAEELGLADVEVKALVTVLRMLECDDIAPEMFHMGYFKYECQTPACICGWAHHISGGKAFPELSTQVGPMLVYRRFNESPSIIELFRVTAVRGSGGEITPAQAAIALRNFLTCGEPRWAEATAD